MCGFLSPNGAPGVGLFVDYFQPASKEERAAASAIANYYSLPLLFATWRGVQPKEAGLIPGRNAFLFAVAALEQPATVSIIAAGIHSGTTYPDCSAEFLARMQNAIEMGGRNRVAIAAPFLELTKSEIIRYCLDRKIPLDLTYSCERGGAPPCGNCLSCRDREMLHACA